MARGGRPQAAQRAYRWIFEAREHLWATTRRAPRGCPLVPICHAANDDERLAGHYRLDAVRAHLFEMAGDHQAAIVHYRAAAGRTASIPERDYLITRAARLTAERK